MLIQNISYKTKSKVGERAYIFGLRIIKLCNILPNKKVAWIISDQLMRSSMSIGANIAEAQGSSSRIEFKRFYEISLRSAHESLYWLHILFDAKLATKINVSLLIVEINEILKILTKAILSLKKSAK